MSLSSERFIKPLYDSYCFSNIPSTIEKLLGVETEGALPEKTMPEGKYGEYQKVVFLFVDAFGWKSFERFKDRYPALQKFVRSGAVSEITSQFPSTTPVHVTTINTGLSVGESGVYEWFYYEPKLDAVIAPLLFSFAKNKERDTLVPTGIDPKDLFPTKTIYDKFKKYGIKSSIFQPAEFAFSPYNKAVTSGVDNVFPYISCAEGLTKLADDLMGQEGKSYHFYYYGMIDSMGHTYGPDSKYFEAEVDLFFTALDHIFLKAVEGKVDNTMILLSADHGQTNVDPKTTVYLNREIKNIADYFKTTKDGLPIVPAGSCRDMFLHVKEEKIPELIERLDKLLAGKAEVYKTEELIKQGFFGSKISKTFLSRVGNVVVLPYAGESVWWYEEGVFKQRHKGHHGGLTPEEMKIPFLALPF